MNIGIFLTALIIATNFLFGTTYAEQAAANEYRKIFESGNFYVEFRDKWGTRILAAKNNMRLERMRYDFESGAAVWFNPLGAIFFEEEKNPEVMYKDGKFYHFVTKRKANVCDEKDLHGENMDPRQGWNTISQKLALPDELAIFYWKDPYRLKDRAIMTPNLMESFKHKFKGEEFDCDRYTCDIKNAAGGDSAYLVYDALYKNGQLLYVESSIFRNGKFYPVNILEVKKIQSEIPEGTFKISKDTKLYAAGNGDINDLLETPTQIGTIDSI